MNPVRCRLNREGARHTVPATMVAAVLLCLGIAVDGSAQQPMTQGLMVGLDVGGAAVSFENQPCDRAGMVGARAGYGLNRILTLYLGIYEADVDTPGFRAFDKVTLGHVDLGARLHLHLARSRWVPYVDPAWTLRIVQHVPENAELNSGDFSSAAFSLGGGLAVYHSDTRALDLNLKWGKGVFKGAPVGDPRAGGLDGLDLDAASVRFTVGFSWWP